MVRFQLLRLIDGSCNLYFEGHDLCSMIDYMINNEIISHNGRILYDFYIWDKVIKGWINERIINSLLYWKYHKRSKITEVINWKKEGF